ncbi:MAG TPA: Druantia anti-phage system protein DruA [Gemmatimonadales bacterium]|nr:Druantia anti-phage system protein DruA [Gemmatimonadales bacterium]
MKADPAECQRALAKTIDPYVQIVEGDTKCALTGIRLADIWRYFRHTWNTAYQSTPGRKLFFLIRDRAVACHPIIGIGALGSSIVQLNCRDKWIGWTPSEFIRHLRATPSASTARWLLRSVDELLDDILSSDLIKEGALRRRDLAKPSGEAIDRLTQLARQERERHHLFPARNRHKAGAGAADWAGLSQTSLFRAKRALALAELLAARRSLQQAGLTRPTKENLVHALEDRQAVAAIGTILRRMKAASVGVRMMDITVCGAIAPYNALLGGKLVGLLAASPAVSQAYERRYRSTPSIIASSLSGRPIIRKSHLVLLGTTSLYDATTSQYNRLRMPATAVGGPEGFTLEYIPLGKTVGYGSFHFSQGTMDAFETLLARRQKGRQVNSIFGEGVNPKLRKVRGALDAVGMPSDLLLQHGSPRLVFGVPLATNFREILLGMERRPKPIIPQTETATQGIIDFWRTRWLARRILHEGTIERVAQHSTVYPIRHGARVILPAPSDDTGPLFGPSTPGTDRVSENAALPTWFDDMPGPAATLGG